jgi:hypothetical protein
MGSQPVGMLGIIAPKNYAGERLRPTVAVLVSEDDMSCAAALPVPDVRVLAAAPCRFILGETNTLAQGLGSFVIIAGALALSFEFGRRGMRFKRNVVALMLGA